MAWLSVVEFCVVETVSSPVVFSGIGLLTDTEGWLPVPEETGRWVLLVLLVLLVLPEVVSVAVVELLSKEVEEAFSPLALSVVPSTALSVVLSMLLSVVGSSVGLTGADSLVEVEELLEEPWTGSFQSVSTGLAQETKLTVNNMANSRHPQRFVIVIVRTSLLIDFLVMSFHYIPSAPKSKGFYKKTRDRLFKQQEKTHRMVCLSCWLFVHKRRTRYFKIKVVGSSPGDWLVPTLKVESV